MREHERVHEVRAGSSRRRARARTRRRRRTCARSSSLGVGHDVATAVRSGRPVATRERVREKRSRRDPRAERRVGSRAPTIASRFSRRQRADRVDRVRLGGGLVVAVAQHAREPQGHAARVARRALQAVERDLDHLLGADGHDPAVVAGRQLREPLGLPREHLVGHALERLAQHHEPAGGVARAEVDVGQVAAPTPGAVLDREDDQVEGVPRLDLDPPGTATTRLVRRRRRLHDDALLAVGRRRPRTASDGLVGRRRHEPLHGPRTGDGVQGRQPREQRRVEQVDAVHVQAVEEERRQDDLGRRGRGPGRGLLERPRPTVRPDRERLAVEHQRSTRAARARSRRSPARAR